MHRFPPSSRPARLAPAVALSLLATLAPGIGHALVHDRMPGDDAGGATTLPAAPGIGEDGRAPVYGADPDAAPAVPAVASEAA